MKDTANFYPVPNWITEEYLENVLKSYYKDNTFRLIEVVATPATTIGESYVSVMTELKVKFVLNNSKRVQEGFYIVKSTLDTESFMAKVFETYEVWKTEMFLYERVLPKLTEMLKEINDNGKIFANTIYADRKNSAIIFEDLAASNFIMGDRLVGMDMPYAKQAIEKLAKMHALSAVFNERNNGILEKFDHGLFNRHTRGFAPFVENLFELCAKFAATCDELGKYYHDKLLKLKPHAVDYATQVVDPHKGHFHTLLHGDFWINNFMIKYGKDKTNIEDLVLIDFQFATWASPAVDLHYLFNSSLQRDLRFHHQDELTQFYYNILTSTLRKLNFKGFIPSLHEFCIQMEAGRFYAVIVTIVTQALMINDQTEDALFERFLLDDERSKNFRKVVYSNKVLLENITYLLPIFDRKGLLDLQ